MKTERRATSPHLNLAAKVRKLETEWQTDWSPWHKQRSWDSKSTSLLGWKKISLSFSMNIDYWLHAMHLVLQCTRPDNTRERSTRPTWNIGIFGRLELKNHVQGIEKSVWSTVDPVSPVQKPYPRSLLPSTPCHCSLVAELESWRSVLVRSSNLELSGSNTP